MVIYRAQKVIAPGQKNLKSLQLLHVELSLSLKPQITCQQQCKVDGTENAHFLLVITDVSELLLLLQAHNY